MASTITPQDSEQENNLSESVFYKYNNAKPSTGIQRKISISKVFRTRGENNSSLHLQVNPPGPTEDPPRPLSARSQSSKPLDTAGHVPRAYSITVGSDQRGVRFNPLVQERILYRQVSQTVLLSRQLSQRFDRKEEANSSTAPAEIAQEKAEEEEEESLVSSDGEEVGSPREGAPPGAVSPEPLRLSASGAPAMVSPPAPLCELPHEALPGSLPELSSTFSSEDSTCRSSSSSLLSPPKPELRLTSSSSSQSLLSPDAGPNPISRSKSANYSRTSYGRYRDEQMKSPSIYSTLQGYIISLSTSLKTLNNTPSSWIEIYTKMPDGIKKFRDIVVARSDVAYFDAEPHWDIPLYLEDLPGGPKATIVIQVMTMNALRETSLFGTTQAILVEDILYSKPSTFFDLCPNNAVLSAASGVTSTKRRKSSGFGPLIKLISANRAAPQERSRFYSLNFSAVDIPVDNETGEERDVYVEVMAIPDRSLKCSMESTIPKYVPIAKTEMAKSSNAKWDSIVLDVQACGGRFSVIYIRICTFTELFEKECICQVATTLHELTQEQPHFPMKTTCSGGECVISPLLEVNGVTPLGGDENDMEPNLFIFSLQAIQEETNNPFICVYGKPRAESSYPYHYDLSQVDANDKRRARRQSKRILKDSKLIDLTDLRTNELFPNLPLIYKSEISKEKKWQIKLSLDCCGGLDDTIFLVLMNWNHSFNHTPIGYLTTTLRELTLKNSIFQIEKKEKKDITTCEGLFVIASKIAQFTRIPPPPKAYLVKFMINGYPEDATFWVAIRAKPYSSNDYIIVQEATLTKGQLLGAYQLDFEKFGGLDSEFSLEVYYLSQKTFKATAISQLVLTLRELSFCKASGITTFAINNVPKKRKSKKWSKLKAVIDFISITPVEAERNYMAPHPTLSSRNLLKTNNT